MGPQRGPAEYRELFWMCNRLRLISGLSSVQPDRGIHRLEPSPLRGVEWRPGVFHVKAAFPMIAPGQGSGSENSQKMPASAERAKHGADAPKALVGD